MEFTLNTECIEDDNEFTNHSHNFDLLIRKSPFTKSFSFQQTQLLTRIEFSKPIPNPGPFSPRLDLGKTKSVIDIRNYLQVETLKELKSRKLSS